MARNRAGTRSALAGSFLAPAQLPLVAGLALATGAGDVQSAAGGNKTPVEFDEVRLIIEFNSTDEDVGVQFFLDVDSWKSVRILNPLGKEIFDARARGRLLQQGGGTEMFVES